jgi:hypothetical protein
MHAYLKVFKGMKFLALIIMDERFMQEKLSKIVIPKKNHNSKAFSLRTRENLTTKTVVQTVQH